MKRQHILEHFSPHIIHADFATEYCACHDRSLAPDAKAVVHGVEERPGWVSLGDVGLSLQLLQIKNKIQAKILTMEWVINTQSI